MSVNHWCRGTVLQLVALLGSFNSYLGFFFPHFCPGRFLNKSECTSKESEKCFKNTISLFCNAKSGFKPYWIPVGWAEEDNPQAQLYEYKAEYKYATQHTSTNVFKLNRQNEKRLWYSVDASHGRNVHSFAGSNIHIVKNDLKAAT